MLGLIFIYFLGKYFYELAIQYDKNKWGFAIAGIVVYYSTLMLAAFMIGVISELIQPGLVDDSSAIFMSLLAIPFGLLSAYLFYNYLKKKWSNEHKIVDADILDAEL